MGIVCHPGPRGFLLFFLGKFYDANRYFYFFHWHEAESREKKASRPLGSSLSCHQLLTVVTDWRQELLLEDIFNCSTSHLIGRIKYLWECDWSKNDGFDSCQVLSQHESEILNDLD